jgi:hypothetical protein
VEGKKESDGGAMPKFCAIREGVVFLMHAMALFVGA